MQLTLPFAVQNILQSLTASGFSAFAVGGCVRDALQGKPPADWDIATSASPDEMRRVFAGQTLLSTGEQHGTLTLLYNNTPYEITTFRTDGVYTDGRHPGTVSFVADIVQDLARRDFTVNAMAYHPATGVIDPFGGRQDLQAKLLRAVGCASQRFAEDALRILRGVRFAARGQMTVEVSTAAAMLRAAHTLQKIAPERIGAELAGLLLAEKPGTTMAQFAAVLAAAVQAPQKSNVRLLKAADALLPSAQIARWALLCTALCCPAQPLLVRLGRGKAFARQVAAVQQYSLPKNKQADVAARYLLHTLGTPCALAWLALQNAVQNDVKSIEKSVEKAIEENACVSLGQLQINGSDAVQAGLQGPCIQAALQAALAAVLDGTLPNERIALLRFLQQHQQAE